MRCWQGGGKGPAKPSSEGSTKISPEKTDPQIWFKRPPESLARLIVFFIMAILIGTRG